MRKKLQSQKNQYRQKLGKHGEDIASSYLQKKGFRVIERNFRARYGEIDLICLDRNTLVFVEVKTRIGETYGKPEEAVTPRKLAEVVKTAQYYSMLHPELPSLIRIDVVAIQMTENSHSSHLTYIPNVTM